MIGFNSLVVLVTPKGKRYVKKIIENQDWHSNDGTLLASDIAKLEYGDEIITNKGIAIHLLEATLTDILSSIKRQTQIIYDKDIAYICLKLGIGENRTILEAGCGSGGLTLAMSWFAGQTGKIISHDTREEFIKLTRRNLDWAGVGKNVSLHHKDIIDGFAEKNADAIFLDVRTPWLYLDQAHDSLKAGGTLGFLLPTTDQINALLLALEKKDFSEIEISEIFIRKWKPIADRLRPTDRMIAHTGFLIFCRKQKTTQVFLKQKPHGTRERKQEAALQSRLFEDNTESDLI